MVSANYQKYPIFAAIQKTVFVNRLVFTGQSKGSFYK